MSNKDDILKGLGEHEAKPHYEIELNIFKDPDADKQIQDEAALKKQFEQLQELEIIPPLNAFTFIKNKINSSFKLTFLQEKEIVPPPVVYTSIRKQIISDNRRSNSAGTAVIKTIYSYRAVAAAILIVLAGWYIYKAGSSHKTQGDVVKRSLITPAAIKTDSAIVKATTNNIVVESAEKIAGSTTENYFNDQRISVDDYNFSVINNDLLTTFASFNYQQLPSFIGNDDPKKFTIRIDQYSAISVSEGMSSMIGKMNRFRRNDKRTRGAKKTRATLEKWKKADAKRFDSSLANDPLDAVDLAKFIFN